MGIPDLLKFVSKSAPGALCQLPRGHHTGVHYPFDFVFVDGTNLFQTGGIPSFLDLMRNEYLDVGVAVVLVLDAQRRRAGSAREVRTSAFGHDAETALRNAAVQLGEILRFKSTRRNAGEPTAKKPRVESGPSVLVCGRNVAGEGDYKMLHIQRSIVASHLAANPSASLPTFLFISEDSDVLCGALCGPAPQNAFMATKLHQVTHEMCILRISHVLAFLGQGADVLLYKEASAEPLQIVETPIVPVVATPQLEDKDVVRRHAPQGPLVAAGKKTKLADDSDEDKEEPVAPPRMNPAATAVARPVTDALREIATYVHETSIDFVFLFTIMLGNGSTVPPLARGATKVDVASCWQAYCAENKYAKRGSAVIVNRLLSHSATSASTNVASVAVSVPFLRTILQALSYADVSAVRHHVAEEREQARKFLTQAATATLRYVVGCNLSGLQADASFLETRQEASGDRAETEAPTLASLLSVLTDSTQSTVEFTLIKSAEHSSKNPDDAHHNVPLHHNIDSRLEKVEARAGAHPISHIVQPLCDVKKSIMDRLAAAAAKTGTIGTAFKLNNVYHLVEQVWCHSLAHDITTVQDIARESKAGARRHPGGTETARRSSYSFELRRLAPVISGSQGKPDGPPSSAMLSVMKAAGLSVAYDAAVRAVAPTTPRTMGLPSSSDKKTGNKVAPAVVVPPVQPPVVSSDGVLAKGKRPGKKERERRKAERLGTQRK